MKTLISCCFCLCFHFLIAREIPGIKSKSNEAQKMSGTCSPASSQMELNINNVRTTLLNGGDMWWDLSNSKYEIPVGSGKHSVFAGGLWIGGVDGGGQVKVAAQTYRQTGHDFWPGAIDTSIMDITNARCLDYNKHWKINRTEVVNFINTGTVTNSIISWPGNGVVASNEGHYLAPFFDNNGDGIYNHVDGDYPGYNLSSSYPTLGGTSHKICDNYLFGDQTIWWVINDVGNVHTSSSSASIGLEIRCQAFAISASPGAINNSTFYKYQVINRSNAQLNNTYFGQWIDPDIGNYVDDFVGCDVIRGLGYCYNSDNDDQGASGYGIDPPAIGVDFLQGPYADLSDGIDNDRDGCIDCTYIDSLGNIIVYPDFLLPEGMSMTKFVYYNNSSNPATGNPFTAANYYNYLKGIWLDNQPITYGGDGRNLSNPVCSFMFPGQTDPLFTTNWTEVTAGSFPDDRRFLQSAGPFTMMPGEVNYITTAVVWARQTGGGPIGSVNLLKQHDDIVQQLFANCFSVTGVGVNEINESVNISVYPNPTTDVITFQINNPLSKFNLKIYNFKGAEIANHQLNHSGIFQWDTSNLPKGTYLYKMIDEKNNFSTGKVVVY